MIISFRNKQEEREVADFVRRLHARFMPRALYFRDYLQGSKRWGYHVPIETMEMIERLEALELLWMGLPPKEAEEFIELLAPAWAEWKALRARNKASADRAIAEARAAERKR
jgi:hypothetical protein